MFSSVHILWCRWFIWCTVLFCRLKSWCILYNVLLLPISRSCTSYKPDILVCIETHFIQVYLRISGFSSCLKCLLSTWNTHDIFEVSCSTILWVLLYLKLHSVFNTFSTSRAFPLLSFIIQHLTVNYYMKVYRCICLVQDGNYLDHWINILVNSIVVLPFMVSAVHQINIERDRKKD